MAFAGGRHVMNFQLQDTHGVGGKQDRHVVDIQVVRDAAGAGVAIGATTACCVLCAGPLKWVAIGGCGHGVMCSKCMVHVRHVKGDKRCPVCEAECPSVMVTRANGGGGGGGRAVATFPKYFYHAKTAAYFDDERRYLAARDACDSRSSYYYRPLYVSIPLLTVTVIIGALLGYSFTDKTTLMAMKVVACFVGILFCLLVIGFFWFYVKWNRDPYQEEEDEIEEHVTQIAKPVMPLEQQLHAEIRNNAF